MKIILVGDVHGKVKQFNKIVNKYKNDSIIQVGDMGIGFVNVPEFPGNVMFISGNHDNPELCLSHPNYLGRFGFKEQLRMFYVSGAASAPFDVIYRKENIDWWRDEELNYQDASEALELYKQLKPNFVVTHDAPFSIIQANGFHNNPNTTNLLFQSMFEEYQPKYWFYGHHHQNVEITVNKTFFRCIAELSTVTLDIDKGIVV